MAYSERRNTCHPRNGRERNQMGAFRHAPCTPDTMRYGAVIAMVACMSAASCIHSVRGAYVSSYEPHATGLREDRPRGLGYGSGEETDEAEDWPPRGSQTGEGRGLLGSQRNWVAGQTYGAELTSRARGQSGGSTGYGSWENRLRWAHQGLSPEVNRPPLVRGEPSSEGGRRVNVDRLAMAIAEAEEDEEDPNPIRVNPAALVGGMGRRPGVGTHRLNRGEEEEREHDLATERQEINRLSRQRPVGQRKCPILWQGSSDCSEQTRMPAWCITPMQVTDAAQLFSLARSGNRAQPSSRTNGGSFAASLPRNAIYSGMKLEHFTFNKQNRWAAIRAGLRNAPLPPHDLSEMYDFSTCAVVGSSNSVRKSKQMEGASIDKHSVVIRFNAAPTRGHEEWVGSKTTFRMQNPERVGYHESPAEICLVRSYGIRTPGSCKTISISPQFSEYTKYHWAMFRKDGVHFERVNGVDRTKMSTGFMGIVLALHLCNKVDIYGFSQGDGYYYNHKKSTTTLRFGARHPWGLEKQCLTRLTKLPGVTWHS